MPVLRGGQRLATKINITFFLGIDVLNIFHFTTWKKKKTIFSKITVKNYFPRVGGAEADHFWGDGRRSTEMNITFFGGNGVPSTGLKFFSQKKPITSDLNPKNWFWGHIFPHFCGSIEPIISKNNKNNRVYPDPHKPCKFHENQFKIAILIVTSYTYIKYKKEY